jgi:hypothetical protein
MYRVVIDAAARMFLRLCVFVGPLYYQQVRKTVHRIGH